MDVLWIYPRLSTLFSGRSSSLLSWSASSQLSSSDSSSTSTRISAVMLSGGTPTLKGSMSLMGYVKVLLALHFCLASTSMILLSNSEGLAWAAG